MDPLGLHGLTDPLNQIELLLDKLRGVNTSIELKGWVRRELRQVLPHACFLATVGKLYTLGSVPTHRISAEFPLGMIEELKNEAGAINDPLISGWFRNGRLRNLDLSIVSESGDQNVWRSTLLQYGMRSMLVHGVLDYKLRRFAFFQIANIYSPDSVAVAKLVSLLVPELARAAWSAVDSGPANVSRYTFGHPTVALTPAEIHIIELLAQGLSNKEIARLRGVSDSTVKTQVSRTGAKLGATRRAEIVAIAMPMLSPLPAQTLIDYDDV
jgi:DNA-binding CsgD family transcriptional regulator